MSNSPYKYFRLESVELLQRIAAGAMALERDEADEGTVQGVLRAAHTLKGAARVVRLAEVSALAHAIEDCLAAAGEADGPSKAILGTEVLALHDSILVALEKAGVFNDAVKAEEAHDAAATAESGKAPMARAGSERLDVVRVPISELDQMLRGVVEARSRVAATSLVADEVGRLAMMANALAERLQHVSDRSGASGASRDLALELRQGCSKVSRDLAARLGAVRRELGDLHEAASRIRLLRAGELFADLERAVRDAAVAVGKRATFRTDGGDTKVDAQVLASVKEALLHVVRNAVAHGIEKDEDRKLRGKAERGMIHLAVSQVGAFVEFRCSDDGAGMDVAALKAAAAGSGALDPEQLQSISNDEALQLALVGGVSTARRVDDVAGRGIGLEVLQHVADVLNGDVRIESVPGEGTAIILRVPISLSSRQLLEVRCGRLEAALPLDCVNQTLRMASNDVVATAEGRQIMWEGRAIPFVPLDQVLGIEAGDLGPRENWTVVIIQSRERVAALGVDRLLGTLTTVLSSLPELAGSVSTVQGAFLDGEGTPRLVFDPSGLLEELERNTYKIGAAETKTRPPVLVIDDSLTTRMLEQSIFETAGYEVVLAASAEEGLEKARKRTFGVFVCDVEMPGMDGFEFVRQTRSDPVLGQVPAILVTSRNAPEDLRRGMEVGAYAYIIKGEFDEGRLLRAVREVIG